MSDRAVYLLVLVSAAHVLPVHATRSGGIRRFAGPCRAIRGLSNYMFHEAQRMAKEEVQQGNDKFDG